LKKENLTLADNIGILERGKGSLTWDFERTGFDLFNCSSCM